MIWDLIACVDTKIACFLSNITEAKRNETE